MLRQIFSILHFIFFVSLTDDIYYPVSIFHVRNFVVKLWITYLLRTSNIWYEKVLTASLYIEYAELIYLLSNYVIIYEKFFSIKQNVIYQDIKNVVRTWLHTSLFVFAWEMPLKLWLKGVFSKVDLQEYFSLYCI